MTTDEAIAIVRAIYPDAWARMYGSSYIIQTGDSGRVPGLAGDTEAEAWQNAATSFPQVSCEQHH